MWLLCSWTSPGKNIGEGCHSPLQRIYPTQDQTCISGVSCTGRWVLCHCATLEYLYLLIILFYFILILFFQKISWKLITLQYCSGFCHTLTRISHGFTCIPHPDPPSHLSLHPIPLGLPSAPGPSTCIY